MERGCRVRFLCGKPLCLFGKLFRISRFLVSNSVGHRDLRGCMVRFVSTHHSTNRSTIHRTKRIEPSSTPPTNAPSYADDPPSAATLTTIPSPAILTILAPPS